MPKRTQNAKLQAEVPANDEVVPPAGGTTGSTMDLASSVHDELCKAIKDDDIINKLVSVIRTTLITELTPIITEKVTQSIDKSIELQLKSRDDRIAALESKLDSITKQNDDAEQYSRRNCIVFHGLPETDNENTDETIIKICREKMKLQIESKDLDRSHRLGRSNGGKPRGIIAKFANYNSRDKIYRARKVLRNCSGTPVYIHESLTKMRSELFWKVKSSQAVKVAWTQDGRVYALLKKDDKRITLSHKGDLEKLTGIN